MIAGLKPYAAYTDSGLPWLGQMPSHWGQRRTKFLFRERVEKGFPEEPLLAATQSKGVVRKAARGHRPEPELDRLSNILKSFNDQFGTLFTDTDRVAKRIREDIAPKVAADAAYQNARENTPHTARMAHDQALARVMQHLLKDDTQVYKQFVENESFKRFVGDMVYAMTNS